MGRKLETVEIQHPRDPSVPIRINKSDFDPAVHKVWQPVPDPKPLRLATSRKTDWYLMLSSAGWREVKDSAAAIGYHKPDGLSWEDAIPEIIAHEEALANAQDQ